MTTIDPTQLDQVEPPIACTLDRSAVAGRADEFRQLCADALVGREHTVAGVRLRFRAAADVEARVRALVTKEEACCAFITSTVTVAGGEVMWDAAVPDDARPLLDDWYDAIGGGMQRSTGAATATRVSLTTKPGTPATDAHVPRKSFAPAGALVAGLLCALACAVPAIGASLVAGASARWLHIPVWSIVVVGGAFVGAWVWRRARGGSDANCGC